MKIQDITEGYGRYYCSTDKKWKTRKGPKQTRKVNEFAPGGFNGGDDGEEFNPNLAKMAYDEGVVKGASLTDGATLERAMAINDWDKHDGGIYKQHFAKGFIAGRKDKIRHNNKQYNLNLQLMKDGSIRHGEQGVAEEKTRLDPKCWDGYKKDGTKMKGGVRVNNCVKEDSLEEYGDTAQGQKMLTKVQKRAVDRVVSKKADTDPKYAKKNSDTAKRAWDRMTDLEETYDGDEFFEAYGELWYNEDEQLDEAEYQGRSVPLGKPMQGDVKKFKVYVKDPSTGNVKKVNFGDPDMKIRKSNPAARRSFRARHNCDNPGPRTKARYWSCRKW